MVRKSDSPRAAKRNLRVVDAAGASGSDGTLKVKKLKLEELSPQDRRVQVAAARLRVTLDKRLDRPTPPEVTALAQQDL